ncbi:hypothetical protein ACXWRW_11140, partial [Streptococcus pyogenes]
KSTAACPRSALYFSPPLLSSSPFPSSFPLFFSSSSPPSLSFLPPLFSSSPSSFLFSLPFSPLSSSSLSFSPLPPFLSSPS